MSARVALVAAAALAIGAAGCKPKGSSGAGPRLGGRVADPADGLLAYVPPEASFVFVRDQQAGMADRFSDLPQLATSLRGLRAALDPSEGPGTAFTAALLDALVVPGAARDALGWREGQSVLVVYGLGFDTVARAALDGARLRATLERAAGKSGFPLTPLTARGHTYYRIEIPTPAFSMTLVMRIETDGAVVALGGDGERLLEHVLADRPAGARFDAAAVIAAAYPDRPDARFSLAIFPARLSAALAQVVARRPPWLLPITPCAEAAVELLAATPSVRAAWVPQPARFEAVGLVDVAPPTAARLARELQPIPRWPDDDGRMRLGVGVSPRTLVDVAEPWLAAIDRLAACSDEDGGGADMVASLRTMLAPSPFGLVTAGVLEVEPRSKSVAAVVGARDLQALWASLRSLVPPLRVQPPRAGEQLALPGAVLLGGGDALGLGLGEGGADAVAALMAAPPGPRSVFAFQLGRGVIEELRASGEASIDAQFGSLAFDVGVRDGRVIFTMNAESAGGRPQLAH